MNKAFCTVRIRDMSLGKAEKCLEEIRSERGML